MTEDLKETEFESYLILVSQDELAFILRSVNATRLPGFTIPEDFGEIHAEVVTRTLLARGLASFSPEEAYTIDDNTAAILSCGAFAARTLNITNIMSDGKSEQHWFYTIPNLHVYHTELPYGIHAFRSLDGATFAVLVLESLHINPEDDTEINKQPITFPKNVYDQAQQLIMAKESEKSIALLTEQKIPLSVAKLISTPKHKTIISCIYSGQAEKDDSFALFQNEDTYWLLEIKQSFIEIKQMSVANIMDHLTQLIDK